MGHVGNKIAPSLLHPLRLGEIAQHGDRAATGQGRGSHIERAARDHRCGARRLHLFAKRRSFHRSQEIGIANRFDHRSVQARVLWNQAIHGLIGPLHESVGTHGDDGVLHAVE